MKRNILIYLTTVLLTMPLTVQLCSAHDFVHKTKNGLEFYVNVLDTLNQTAEITFKDLYNKPGQMNFYGKVVIPETVVNKGKHYTIVAVGAKAFAGGDRIERVVIPSSVRTIGEYAFESCTSLKTVEFPIGQVALGEGAFWKCSALSDILFGSDWKEIDFGYFRGCDSLKTIHIPTHVEKLTNLKALPMLETLTVSLENRHFSAKDGLLYSKDGKSLYFCPIARTGDIIVADGAEKITREAFLDCNSVKSITLPESIRFFEPLEFFGLESLEWLKFTALEPMTNTEEVKLSLFLNSQVRVYVPKKGYKVYLQALYNDWPMENLVEQKAIKKY